MSCTLGVGGGVCFLLSDMEDRPLKGLTWSDEVVVDIAQLLMVGDTGATS